MSSTISSNYGQFKLNRPDPTQMASKLFSKLDTKNQGYIEQSDLQSAFAQIGSTADSSSVEEVFKQFDSNSDGKVTKDEFSDTLSQLAEELDNQFNQSRMQAAGGMPPPPPPPGGPQGGNDAGFSKEELQSQLEEIGSTDSKRSNLISNIVNNFDEADTDGDGKVSFKEAMAYDQENSSSAASSASDASSSSTASRSNSEASVMMRIMQLVHAYGKPEESQSALSSLLSTQA